MKPGVVLAETTRGDTRSGEAVVESVHTGHLVLTGPDGEVLASVGDPAVDTFVRSTAKPFQAAACLELLALSGGQPSDAEVAVAWSSHRAEPNQLDAVRRLLRRSATPPTALTCPEARGEHDPGAVPARLLHNCSGKHALFALAGMHQGTGRDRLLDPAGPLQRVVLEALADAFGSSRTVGVDGCGAPAVTAPLQSVARAYAALATEQRWQRVREAGLSRPELVGGAGRLESALLAAGVVAKPGAEGIFAAGWVGRDGRPRGLAARTADGAQRATTAAVIAVLVDLGVVPPGTWTPPPVLGGGRPVGEVVVAPAVRTAVADVPA